MKVLALYNIKGGVGKTASTVNLSYYSALAGYRTLVWDLDPQGAATFYFRIKPKIRGGAERVLKKKHRDKLYREIRGSDYENLDVLPADFSYRDFDLALGGTKKPTERLSRVLRPLADEYDVVLLDCAPSISLAAEAIFTASDLLLVPTIPTPLSARALEQLDRHLHASGPKGLKMYPFFCMVDRRKKLHREGERLITGSDHTYQRLGKFLETRVPYSSLVEQMGLKRAPLPSYAYGRKPARAYLKLWREVESRLAMG